MLDGTKYNLGFVIDSDANLLDADSNLISRMKSRGRVWKITPEGNQEVIFETILRLRSLPIGKNGYIHLKRHKWRELS
jgi:hypothetical protein